MPPLSEIASMVAGQIFTTVPVPAADFSGKTIIVTGANSGLGLEACKHLVRLNVFHLILACRDLDKAAVAKEQILASLPPDHPNTTTISIHHLDLSSFSSVTAFATDCITTLPRLDALIANAGIEVKHFSLAEGYEQTLTVNVLSTFLLGLLLLLPKLQQTGEEHNTETYFSVVGSAIQIFAPYNQLSQPNLFAALSDESKADMLNRYYLSKLLCTLCVQAVARRTQHLNHVIINCVSPGFCDTGLYSHFSPPLYTRVLLRVIGSSAEEGSRCLVWGVLGGRGSHGGFMSEGVVKEGGKWMGSEEGVKVRERVWREVVGVLEGVRPGVGEGLGK
ncbi:hypothetical protein M409DRAFT_66767 [Zasmidium cellare ATCC 36951]|uniref:Ketoreductase (KR) domain-containing protein n=1 Tax=Zasmidium cellare ATCC 36951 TaxID=1080233 RepID=A0A6A6CGJ2_ZASCE|nr:uncharacterized protein M409DRAFT_66767 [Zasmidium cellare ATCC 36951]KAF2166304.1 hypothetical protein M409DRAFT_66767 [Zasmidium cellare ATCC 36951]